MTRPSRSHRPSARELTLEALTFQLAADTVVMSRNAFAEGGSMTTERLTPLTDLESDALAELANVAMARAAVSFRTMIHLEVLLSVPSVELLAPRAAIERVAKPGNPNLVAVRQDFSGVFSGRALLIFPEASSLELVRVVVGRQLALEDIVDLEDEALAETGNIILNSWVATIANLLKKNLKMSLPVVIRRDQNHIFENVSPRNPSSCFFTSSSTSVSSKSGAMSP